MKTGFLVGLFTLIILAGASPGDEEKPAVAGDAELKRAFKAMEAGNRNEGEKAFKDAEEAVKKALSAAAADQDKGPLLMNLGRVCYYTHRDDEAFRHYREAAKLMPKETSPLYSIASLFNETDAPNKALEAWDAILKIDPEDSLARWNHAQTLQTLGESTRAIAAFTEISKLDPGEWKAIAKIIQLSEALGKKQQRDEWVKNLYAIRKKGKLPSLIGQAFYIRDQFTAGDYRVYSLEYFELKGERAVKYSFNLRDQKTGENAYRISLGSYESTNAIARELGDLKKGERRFHLDGYYPDGAHRTFGFFTGNPGYDQIKKLVKKIVTGKTKAISGTFSTEDGGSEIEIEVDPEKSPQ